ncbi:MAG: magnesium chelatase subunit D [Gemmatimonadota bacterium]
MTGAAAGDAGAAAEEAFATACAVAASAAVLLAVAPHALGGAVVRAAGGEEAQRWTAALARLFPRGTPMRRLPASVTDDRLLGGLDLAATLAAGRPVAERGLLAEADGGLLLVPGAERLGRAVVSRLCAVLDDGEVQLARDGVTGTFVARAGIVALDDHVDDDERVAPPLAERLAFAVAVPARWDAADQSWPDADDLAAARAGFGTVTLTPAQVEALAGTAAVLGVAPLRATLLAARAARASAALGGRDVPTDDDLRVAVQLVFAPRATRLPAPPEEAPEDQPEPPPPPDAPPEPEAEGDREDPKEHEETHVEAASAAIPADLLALLAAGPMRGREQGRSGGEQQGAMRGRQIGSRHGQPRGGKRLHVLDTLRAAAPWQRVRRRLRGAAEPTAGQRPERVEVGRDDFRIRRFVEKAGTTVIFAVDASGSSALNRMNEAKGAVEQLLAESYARRDKVALIAFRGPKAEVLLPPTRALARARRALTGLPGGGGTPLASAIDLALGLAQQARREGNQVLCVFLTDARANIGRDGQPGRPKAEADALAAAQAIRVAGIPGLFVDTSPRGERNARAVSEAMGARYLLLPTADAKVVTGAVKTMVGS